MAKLVFIVAPNFRDAELFEPKAVLEQGNEIKIASTRLGEIEGTDSGSAKADIAIESINSDEFDALVLIGGPGMSDLIYDESKALRIIIEKIKEFNSAGKLIAAICVSPIALARAGVIFGKTVTSWDSKGEQEKELTNAGAVFKKENVVQDGNIITANGPRAATQFGEKIKEYLRS